MKLNDLRLLELIEAQAQFLQTSMEVSKLEIRLLIGQEEQFIKSALIPEAAQQSENAIEHLDDVLETMNIIHDAIRVLRLKINLAKGI